MARLSALYHRVTRPWLVTRYRLVTAEQLASAETDPGLTELQLRILRKLEHWPIGHQLNLDNLARSLDLADSRPVIFASVAYLEDVGWLPAGRLR